MAEVACYCGCSYSFFDDVGACPQCGEVATLPTQSVPDFPVLDCSVPASTVPASTAAPGAVPDQQAPAWDEACGHRPLLAWFTPTV